MARKLAELMEKRAAKRAEMASIHDKAANENREFAADEATRFDALKAEERSLAAEIDRGKMLAEMEREADASPIGEEGREMRAFSLAKAIQENMNGRLTGREA